MFKPTGSLVAQVMFGQLSVSKSVSKYACLSSYLGEVPITDRASSQDHSVSYSKPLLKVKTRMLVQKHGVSQTARSRRLVVEEVDPDEAHNRRS